MPLDTGPKTDAEWHELLPTRIHGKNDTYCTWACRCSECRDAHAAHKLLYRQTTKKLLGEADDRWMQTDLKNCHGMNTTIFYPTVREQSDDYELVTAEAKKICEGCCVQRPCLEYAILTREQGVWGGTNDRDRRRIKRKRANP